MSACPGEDAGPFDLEPSPPVSCHRYERASLIVTSNKSFVDWGKVPNDHVEAEA